MFAVLGITGSVVIPIGRAIARKISGSGAEGIVAREVQMLRDEVEQLRAELEAAQGRISEVDELHSRLDFTERMIAQLKGKPVLPGGS